MLALVAALTPFNASPVAPPAPARPAVLAAPLIPGVRLDSPLIAPADAPDAQFDAGRRAFDGVPADFGAKDGAEIDNKASILPALDAALGAARAPSLEYIWVRPLAVKKVAGFKLGANPYGHAAIRYTMPDGTQKVMNIVGAKGKELVNFLKPEDYLYGTADFDEGSEQGGVYNRGMVSVRIERLPDEAILALDRYYSELGARAETGKAKFALALSKLFNVLGAVLPGHQAERGNCARWTSMGLCAAGIVKAPTLWPKKLWIDLYESARRADPANVRVVVYRRVAHAVLTYGIPGEPAGLVAPFRWLLHRKYWDLEKRADAVVEVPAGSRTARVRLLKTPAQ